MSNTFVKIPKKGDAVVGNLSTGKVEFIEKSTFNLSDLDTTAYETIGVVVRRNRRKVLIAYKQNASKTWCDIYWWMLTGYTLDSTDRTGVISIRDNSSAAANTDYTVNYNASSKEDLVQQLNSFFADTANPVFQTQDWYAEIDSDNIIIHCAYTFWQQASYNTAKNGFTFTANTMPDVAALANMRRKHGGNGGEGSVSNKDRALSYFRADNSSTTYNPATNLTNIKTAYPVCLPAYLGTSQYQDDHCSLLRQTYGEGEAGWLRYMEAQRPQVPTDYGNMGMRNGLERTAVLAAKTYSSQKKTNETMCKAAYYCYNIGTVCIPQGKWHLPTTEELYHILDGLKYGTSASRDADPINATLNKMGGTAISNGTNLWSCLRCGAGYAWYAYGYNGCFNLNYFCFSYGCVPLSLYELP